MPTAQVVTVTETTFPSVKKVVWDWLCTDGGVVASTTTYQYDGQLLAVMFVPDTSTTAPDDQYDATITDGTYDLLNGQGANLSATNTIVLTANMIPATGHKLTLNISGAGDANGGIVIAYIR